MLVADNTQTASSATLGAQRTRAVTMVEDASFFMMLSSNLYSNQKLACIREILCNAWDAHIDAGRTDQYINVKITKDGDLIIQDSGKGIHDDFIEAVYGTYGGSTKRTDTKTTGGFGLGSKSPWAYTESFLVTSEHEGVKTVYNMARTCVENDGKPGILPVVGNLPTDRSGLTVEFRLEPEDVEEMQTYIWAIAQHGDMRVMFHNEFFGQDNHELKRLEMSDEPGSYSLDHEKWLFDYMGNHRVFIRYGAVIYPVLRTPATEDAIAVIEKFMGVVGYRHIVVQAAPSTLALTPSREALSSQKMTENGIVDICVNLVDKIEKEIKEKVPAQMEFVKEMLLRHNYGSSFGSTIRTWENIPDSVVQRYVKSQLGKQVRIDYYGVFHKIMEEGYYKHLKAAFPPEQARFLIKTCYKMLNNKKQRFHNEYHVADELFKQYFMKPLGRLMHQIGVPANSLSLHVSTYWHDSTRKDNFVSEFCNVIDVKRMMDAKRIFITTRSKGMTKSVSDFFGGSKRESTVLGFSIKVSQKKGEMARVVAGFRAAGWEVIDMSEHHVWDSIGNNARIAAQAQRKAKDANAAVKLAAPKAPANVLLPLRNIYNPQGEKIIVGNDVTKLANPTWVTDKPLFYFEENECKTNGNLGKYTRFEWLTEDETGNGIVVRNGTERNMAIKRGAIPGDKYFVGRFIEKLTSPEYKRYMTKLRKKSLREVWDIESADLKLLRLLGVKLSGYDRLTHDPVLEKWKDLLSWLNLSRAESNGEITAEQHDLLNQVGEYQLEQLKFIEKLKNLKRDRMVSRLGSDSRRLIDLLTRYPERKAALKSLVLCALKTGKKSDE